jgi:hypothetical protein
MQKTGDRASRAVARGAVVAATAVAAIFTMLPSAVAEAPAPAAPGAVEREGLEGWDIAASRGGVSTQSASSGSRSGDFSRDGVSDILARQADNGALKVYPHSGTFNGAATYLPSVTINGGWGGMRWIGQGDMDADGDPDVVYIDGAGVMRIAPHGGVFNGTATLTGTVEVATGWGAFDLVTTGDIDGDGYDDVIARLAGTETAYVYYNNGGINGYNTLLPGEPLITGVGVDVEEVFADFTGDGIADMLFIQNDGVMGLFDPSNGVTYTVSYGWGGVNAITVTDVDRNGWLDVLARISANGNLVAYRHSGSWTPTQTTPTTGTAFNTLTAGVFIGSGWQTNNVIS